MGAPLREKKHWMDVDHKKNLLRRKIYRQPPPLDFLPDGRNRLNRSHRGDLIRKFVFIDEAVEIGAKKPTRRPFEGACNRRDPKRQKIFGKWKNVAGGKARPKSAYSAGKKCQMPSRCAALRHLITSAQRNFFLKRKTVERDSRPSWWLTFGRKKLAPNYTAVNDRQRLVSWFTWNKKTPSVHLFPH